MFRIIKKSLGYALLTTVIYFIAANIAYYYFNKRTMFADIYFYEWVEYVIAGVIILICSLAIELFRNWNGNEA